ncbi:unnamed protein product [Dracunculus medinensis]|uniref:Glyco_transf_5 domain-containing protein n=1 Tax=Dracunculus medinensis TaxID=318479 RepID=A0A0N4URA2_DRAME|nr:unnamed protein product [Dracunculus medinensis]
MVQEEAGLHSRITFYPSLEIGVSADKLRYLISCLEEKAKKLMEVTICLPKYSPFSMEYSPWIVNHIGMCGIFWKAYGD